MLKERLESIELKTSRKQILGISKVFYRESIVRRVLEKNSKSRLSESVKQKEKKGNIDLIDSSLSEKRICFDFTSSKIDDGMSSISNQINNDSAKDRSHVSIKEEQSNSRDEVAFPRFFFSRALLPEEWRDRLDDFQKIIFLKCLRPDKVTNAMQDFVAGNLGQRFIEPQVSSDETDGFRFSQLIIEILCRNYSIDHFDLSKSDSVNN